MTTASETRHDSHEASKPNVPRQLDWILRALKALPGQRGNGEDIQKQVEEWRYSIDINTLRARLSELKGEGRIIWASDKRTSRDGKLSAVVSVNPKWRAFRRLGQQTPVGPM